jgi:hypothetical protein
MGESFWQWRDVPSTLSLWNFHFPIPAQASDSKLLVFQNTRFLEPFLTKTRVTRGTRIHPKKLKEITVYVLIRLIFSV